MTPQRPELLPSARSRGRSPAFKDFKERKLKDSPHVTDKVLQTQLLNALSGEASDMISSLLAGSYNNAMEQLTAKFGDNFRLAASYIPATGDEARTTKKKKF